MDILEYTKKYAAMYCNGDIKEAEQHAIVREVAKSDNMSVDEYARQIYGEGAE